MPTVLKGMRYEQTFVGFGPVSVLTFPSFTTNGATTSSLVARQTLALPCNIKIIAAAAAVSGASVTLPLGLALNFASGQPPAGNTVGLSPAFVVAGTADVAGVATVTIQGPNAATSLTATFNYNIGATNTQIAAGLAAAVNAAGNPYYTAAQGAPANFLVQNSLSSNLFGFLGGGAQPVITVTPGGDGVVTITPTGPQPLPTGANNVVGTPDNFMTSTPTSAFAGPGQFAFGAFKPIPLTLPLLGTTPVNAVVYPQLITGQPAGSPVGPQFTLPEFDIVFPVTRPLSLYASSPGGGASNSGTVLVSVLMMPVILDPNKPYPAARMWVPNNSNIGAPSTA